MKKYIFTLIALSMIFTATARKPKNTRTTEAAAREIAAADSLRLVASRQAALIDSLQNLVAVAEQRDETAESETAAPDPVVDPEQAAADSVAALRLRLRPTKIESIFDTNGLTVLDTLATENDAVQVILYSNNSWKYLHSSLTKADFREMNRLGWPVALQLGMESAAFTLSCVMVDDAW